MSEAEQSAAPETCPVEMSDDQPCGRPIHPAPQGVDHLPVCLMHSIDPDKDKALFRQEIDAILEGTSNHHHSQDKFDFTRFVFPEANFRETTFTRGANFGSATFTQDADFREATFTKEPRSMKRRLLESLISVLRAFSTQRPFTSIG